jgi:transposase
MFYLGVDVAKTKLDCVLLDTTTNKRKSKSVTNSPSGYAALLAWIDKLQIGKPHVIMEPTGVYHEHAALADRCRPASVAGQSCAIAQLRKYAQGIGVKTKTDAVDSAVLARYGASQHPPLWQPPSASARTLRALLTRRDAVADDLQREKNRAEKAASTDTPPVVQESIEQSISFLENELKQLQNEISKHINNDPDLQDKRKLLLTIPGVGDRVADHFTALLAGRDFDRAEQRAAYLGLVPVEWESGSSVRGRPHLSKTGPSHLRKLLYMPAITAKECNPHVKAIYDQLLKRGKAKMSAIDAAMRKLAHLCFGVVKSGKPYSANWLEKA